MKRMICICCLCLAGCTPGFIRVPAPEEPVPVKTSVLAKGVFKPKEFYFSLVSYYQQGQARVFIFTEPALKLADMTVKTDKIEVHYQAPHLPNKLITAWAELVRTHLFTACPSRQIAHQQPDGIFELEVRGGICP